MTQFPTTIQAMKAGLKAGDFSAVELTEHIFERIAATDDKVKAFLALDKEGALAAAKAADERGYGEDAPLLNGIPLAIKDNILTEGVATTASSKMLEGFIPTYDATVVRRLKEAGAVLVGKTNLDEFAMGSTTETSYYQVTHNPWDLDRVPGGSSGGSAATVAARQVPGALGSDTGGSIRQPAGFVGIVGLKPTYGAVSRLGAIAFGSSLDQVGPMTLTVEDNALMMEVIAGHDPMDMTSIPELDTDYSAKIGQSIKGMKLAYPKEFKSDYIDPEVQAAMGQVVAFFEAQGAEVEEVSLAHAVYGPDVYELVGVAEAAANLQRFDGIRYGYRSPAARNLEEIYVKSRSEGFGFEVKNRIVQGSYSLSADAFHEYFEQAAKVRTLMKQELVNVLKEYDAVLAPTATTPAYELGTRGQDADRKRFDDVLVILANMAGVPSLAVPAGFTQSGLPMGVQLYGRHLDEATLYQLGHAWEAEHNFAAQAPEL